MSQCTRIFLDEQNRVADIEQGRIVDPTPLAADEADFGMAGINPIRKPMGWRLTKVVDLDPPYEQDLEGNDITTATEVIPWKYCKYVDGEIVEMTQEEKDARDAEIAQKESEAKDAIAEADSNLVYLKALVICINKRIPQNPITAAEVKQEIRDLL